jgi:hypothetical protein
MGSSRVIRRVATGGILLVALAAAQAGVARSSEAGQPLDRPNAADNKRAAASVTRFRDLVVGFRVDKKKDRAPLVPYCDGYPGDRSNVTVTGSATSSFLQNNNSIASTVLLFKTPQDADRYWKATVRAKYAQCLSRYVKSIMIASATTTSRLAKQIPIGSTSAEKATAYRTISEVEAPGIKTHTWTETVAFVKLFRAVGIIRVVYINHLCECHTGLALDVTKRLRMAFSTRP